MDSGTQQADTNLERAPEPRGTRATQRLERLKTATADVLQDLVDELRESSPEHAPRLLRQAGRLSELAREELAVLRGAYTVRRRRAAGIGDSDLDAIEDDTDVGALMAMPFGPAMRAETYGAHVLREGMAVVRAYLQAQKAPRLDELLSALRVVQLAENPDSQLVSQLQRAIQERLAGDSERASDEELGDTNASAGASVPVSEHAQENVAAELREDDQ